MSKTQVQRDRRIIGLSLSPQLAGEVKAEAARRGISLRKLFEELWSTYQPPAPAKIDQKIER